MKKSRFLLLWLVPILFSCEKQEKNQYDSMGKILELYDNSFFPLDSNDIWIYAKELCLYDDVDDSIDESYCLTSMDTIIPSQKILIGKIVSKKFGQNYFNTQYNKVSLIIDTNIVFKKQYVIDLLFTDLNDTNWSDTVYHAYFGEGIIRFIQNKAVNDTAEEITLTINPAYLIGLHDKYVFQKNRGVISSSFIGINMDGNTKLKEYKDN